jgi:hypothetical protein
MEPQKIPVKEYVKIFFQINGIWEKTLKEPADYTFFNLVPVLEELWNHRRYRTMKYLKSISKYFFQINRIWEKTLKEAEEYTRFKKHSKIFCPNKQNLGKDS